jgi:hypothetical protein
MEVRLEKDGPAIGSPSETFDHFAANIRDRQAGWRRRATQDPTTFAQVQQEIRQQVKQGADLMTAAVLADATNQPQMQEHVHRVRADAVLPLKAPERRALKIRLAGGLVLWLATLYCAPRARKETDQNQHQRVGLYPELAALGVRHGSCPALQSLVARTVALCPSIEAARKELRRQGVVLDRKTVRRIAEQLGTEFLAWRRRELVGWRMGLRPAGDELAGKRVAVQIDGGRIRLRENKKRSGKRRKGQRRKFKTPWREPKAVIIFTFDERGKMTKKRQPLIDGTLQGPDHLAELVAWHLHRLGAAKAKTVVFLSDGATWIWNRLDWIIARAGLDKSKAVGVLDWCHAVEHINRALRSLKLKAEKRRQEFVQMRTWLKQSRWSKIVSRLKQLAKRRTEKHQVWTEIEYLRKHGEAGHLQYLSFKRRGLPLGSGAIESAIRRVINLRLKSNAIYWLPENAEAVFALRASLLTDRWEEQLLKVQRSMTRDASLSWEWSAPSIAPDAPTPDPPTSPQVSKVQKVTAVAA